MFDGCGPRRKGRGQRGKVAWFRAAIDEVKGRGPHGRGQQTEGSGYHVVEGTDYDQKLVKP